MTDYSKWLTKQAAAEILDVSTKTVEQLAKAGEIHQAKYKKPDTRATISVYHPDDVIRVRQERNPDAPLFIMPPETPQAETPPESAELRTLAPADKRYPAPNFMADLAALAAAAQNSQNRVRKLFLTVKEAAEYSGLPAAHLDRLVKAETLPAIKTGSGWRIRRADLQKL